MKKDNGTTSRFDAPTTNRTACGTMIPTNAMSPLTATAEAAANEAAPMTIQRTLRGRIPNAVSYTHLTLPTNREE